MKEFIYTIVVENGVHARPAGKLVKEASKFESDITIITSDNKTASAKKLFALMKLGIKEADQITVKAEGLDEDHALIAVESFMKKNF